MVIQWFEVQFRAIFSSSRESIESYSKLARNEIASSLVVSNISDWSKSLMDTIFLRVAMGSMCRVKDIPSNKEDIDFLMRIILI